MQDPPEFFDQKSRCCGQVHGYRRTCPGAIAHGYGIKERENNNKTRMHADAVSPWYHESGMSL